MKNTRPKPKTERTDIQAKLPGSEQGKAKLPDPEPVTITREQALKALGSLSQHSRKPNILLEPNGTRHFIPIEHPPITEELQHGRSQEITHQAEHLGIEPKKVVEAALDHYFEVPIKISREVFNRMVTFCEEKDFFNPSRFATEAIDNTVRNCLDDPETLLVFQRDCGVR